jgi:methyl coenzyme M reductase system subunit A2
MEETFIVVSHDLDFVRETCDRIAVMQGGRIMDIGTPSAVLEAQKQKEQERLVSTETGDILLQETSP